MSRAPDDDRPDLERATDYRERYLQFYYLLTFGRSFSGREANCCFLNTRSDQFANVSAVSGLDYIDDSRGLASVDWDYDGDSDLWMTGRTAPRIRYLRNDTPQENSFVSIRLQGNPTTSNRDAIGARVEVITEYESGYRRVKTLRAGEGFRSQSSRWLTFGLGKSETIQHVIVKWPAGNQEKFGDIEVNRWYKLVQGAVKAEAWTPPNRKASLVASDTKLLEPTAVSRTILDMPYPMPNCPFEDGRGIQRQAFERGDKNAVLINLWKSWCGLCKTELAEFAKHENEIRDAGLDIVALNGDRLGGEEIDRAEAARILADIRFPFRSGEVSEDFVNSIHHVQWKVFAWHEELPAPMSLLINRNGDLVAVYRGTVSVSQLLQDVANLDVDDVTRRKNSVPFAGRWFNDPRKLDLRPVGNSFREAGFLKESEAVFRRLLVAESDDSLILAALGLTLRQQGNFQQAINVFRRAIEVDPDIETYYLEYARTLRQMGKHREACAKFREAIKLKPTDASIHYELGRCLCQQEQFHAGVTAYQHALKHTTEEDAAVIWHKLGEAFIALDQEEKGIEAFEKALQYDPDYSPARTSLEDIQGR